MKTKAGFLFLAGVAGLNLADAAPSGLALMPTADLVPGNEYVAEVQLDGSMEHFDADARFINLEVGALDRVEMGVDYDASEETSEAWLFNAKVLLARTRDDALRLAMGVRNLGCEDSPEGYGVGTWSCGKCRAHLGFTASDERNVDGIVGIDYEWLPCWWAYGEWTSGPENAGAVGLNIPLFDGLDFMTGLVIPIQSEEDVGYTAHLVCGGPIPFLHEGK